MPYCLFMPVRTRSFKQLTSCQKEEKAHLISTQVKIKPDDAPR